MKKIILSLLFIFSFSSFANIIKNINVEGLHVISLGTVLNYLPIEKDDEWIPSTSKEIIKKLYKTNFFKSISVTEKSGIVTIKVIENPIINMFEIIGNEIISKEELEPVIESLEIIPGLIYNNYKIDKLIKEMEAVYIAKGYYSLKIDKEITENSDSSINIKVIIKEGVATKINSLQIIGAFSYSEKSLLDLIDLEAIHDWSFFSDADEYSSVVLADGLAKIKNFYETSGYADFKVLTTNISLSKNKGKIDIIINISEGIQYTIGNIIIPEIKNISQEDIQSNIALKEGELYNSKKIILTAQSLKSLVANNGYYLASIEPIINKQRQAKSIDISFQVELSRRFYVKRINIVGNTRTQDDVIRRSIRQIEGGIYSEENVQKSIKKLKRLGYFGEVKVKKTIVEGTNDLLILTFIVDETKTGSFSIGIAQNSIIGTSINLNLAERNFVGSGNTLNLNLTQSKAVKNYSLSFSNPFLNEANHSISYSLYYNETDASKLNQSNYNINTSSAAIGYGIPISEDSRINANIKYSKHNITCGDTFKTYEAQCNNIEDKKNETLLGMSFTNNTLNSYLFPTDGMQVRVNLNSTVSGSDFNYRLAKLTLKNYTSLNKAITFKIKANISYAQGTDGEALPFFRRNHIGNAVRGYEFSTFGPVYHNATGTIDPNKRSKGAQLVTSFGLSFVTPVPLVDDSKSMRLSFFVDAAQIRNIDTTEKTNIGNEETIANSEKYRASVGLGFSWITLIGPLGFYIAQPIGNQEEDKVKTFSLSLGTTF
jgi:outer membrane protein insertion porin family